MSKAEDGTFSVRGLIRLIIPLMIGLTLDLIVGIIDSVMLSGSGGIRRIAGGFADSAADLRLCGARSGRRNHCGAISGREKQSRRKSRGRRTRLTERAGFAGCDASWRSCCANGCSDGFSAQSRMAFISTRSAISTSWRSPFRRSDCTNPANRFSEL